MLADILIVEDEKNISNLIEMALSRHGHKTDCVFDGESCADVLDKKSTLTLFCLMLCCRKSAVLSLWTTSKALTHP